MLCNALSKDLGTGRKLTHPGSTVNLGDREEHTRQGHSKRSMISPQCKLLLSACLLIPLRTKQNEQKQNEMSACVPRELRACHKPSIPLSHGTAKSQEWSTSHSPSLGKAAQPFI